VVWRLPVTSVMAPLGCTGMGLKLGLLVACCTTVGAMMVTTHHGQDARWQAELVTTS
jgi:hypothetical protein